MATQVSNSGMGPGFMRPGVCSTWGPCFKRIKTEKKPTNTKWYRYDCVYEWFEPEIHKIYVKKTEEENMKIE